MKKILSIVGARPQFIKHAPMQVELQSKFIAHTIHTGQHYDKNMSEIFFNSLNISKPEFHIQLENGLPHGKQTAVMMVEIEKIIETEKYDAVVLYGDTNSTLAGALVASKLNIPIAHIEAGLRSFNKQMPEEINRIVTDHVSSFLFCPTSTSIENLANEGIINNVYLSGDIMQDSINLVLGNNKNTINYPYYYCTIHRPYNTDLKDRMIDLLNELNLLPHRVILSIHPRTKNKLNDYQVNLSEFKNINIIDPVGYIESITYQKNSILVITDSGGMQKEAYMLGKKCITIRSETEWIETLENDCNSLVFDQLSLIGKIATSLGENYKLNFKDALYGDGHTAKYITNVLSLNI